MRSGAGRTALVTGGAGFIGSNLVERLLREPDLHVRILDNLSRPGVQRNLEVLHARADSDRLHIMRGDVRNRNDVRQAVKGATEIYHLAAQVAVTTSVCDPMSDFEVNALGTLNVLEAARVFGSNPFFLYTSTNKVYGSLDDLPIEAAGTRYRSINKLFHGVTEEQLLDFHSPYGCSKGAADQYVRDYARIYDLSTVVFRMSCIAGPHQFGNEDQGWVAHFLYSVLAGSPVTIYGDGLQVRDVLHVDDLVEAMLAARDAVDKTRGEIYNLGGGMDRTSSVIEMLRLIERNTGKPLLLEHSECRPGDQAFYISDSTKFESHTGWRATRSIDRALEDLISFWAENKETIFNNAAPATSLAELTA